MYYNTFFFFYFFFFFQAEDGIRDVAVTGVQTCALPICAGSIAARPPRPPGCSPRAARRRWRSAPGTPDRSERARRRSRRDRKSTRLNSSHGYISYAVFCLKKKKNRTWPYLGHSV